MVKKKENKRVFGIFHNEKHDVLHEFIKTSCFTYGLGKNMMFSTRVLSKTTMYLGVVGSQCIGTTQSSEGILV